MLRAEIDIRPLKSILLLQSMMRSDAGTMTSPTHPKAPLYLRGGIFDRLKSFRELEARISALATVQERGDAFEVFAEAYLATVAVEKAKQVWPGASVPPSLRKRLTLTIGDKGVDGVFETQLGGHHAYQVKFRTGRPSLTWDELSNFIGQADRVDRRALITNCDRFADVVKERTAFYAIRRGTSPRRNLHSRVGRLGGSVPP